MTTRLDNWLIKRGITSDTEFLAQTDELRNLFFSEVRHILEENKVQQSNFAKHKMYEHIFGPLLKRPKYTGFENLDYLDGKLRAIFADNGVTVPEAVYNAPTTIGKPMSGTTYKQELFKHIEGYYASGLTPLLYFSGGLDSEVMVKMFQEYGKPFEIVIYRHNGLDGSVLNEHDIMYAINYCEDQDLEYTLMDFETEKFWNSEEIVGVAVDTILPSPQFITYCKMIEKTAAERPGRYHIIGGEPRYVIKEKLPEHEFAGFYQVVVYKDET